MKQVDSMSAQELEQMAQNMINIRPQQKNFSRAVVDESMRQKIINIVQEVVHE